MCPVNENGIHSYLRLLKAKIFVKFSGVPVALLAMAQITYSSSDIHRYRCEASSTAFPLTTTLVKEQIVQQCLRRFYDKHSSIDHYIEKKTQFIASSTFNHKAGEKLSGLISCEALKEKLKSSEIRQILESADLNQEEISLLLETCNSTLTNSLPTQVTEDVSGTEAKANLSPLRSLLEKLSRRSFVEHNAHPEQFKDVLVFESKREFEAAVRDGVVDRELHNQLRTAGQSFTGDAFVKLKSKKRPAVHPDHPLNHLADIDSQLFSKQKTLKRHKNDFTKTTSDSGGPSNSVSACRPEAEGNPTEMGWQSAFDSVFCDPGRRVESQWDVRESERAVSLHKPNSANVSLLSAGKKERNLSEEFVLLPKEDNLLPIPLIKEHCVPLEKLLKEFPQYSRGTPSKTLYLKNLHKCVTPNDLVSLFGHFDRGQERVTYRLMTTGRMRGQAFVKFPDVCTATTALDACLGFKLKGKPLVIQYGKQN